MYHRKKIAAFISHIYGDYQEKLLSGISSKAYELGYPLEVYVTNDGEDLGNYGIGEASILKIPNYSDIEGIIFASGTYSDEQFKEKVKKAISDSGCPVIEVAEKDLSFVNVHMENNLTAGELAKHMITVHSAKRICYLGSKSDNFYSGKREKAYREALKEYDIKCGANDVYECDKSSESFEKALEFFSKAGKFDAVIAYNDNMAIDFIEYVQSKGINVPADFAITGCDCLESGQHITPALTTVSFPLREVGEKAVELLAKLINDGTAENAVVYAKPVYNESCGCKNCSSQGTFKYLRDRNRKIAELEKSMLVSMKMSAALSHAGDIDDAAEVIAENVKMLPDIKEFYLCLYSDWNKITDPVLELANISGDSDFIADDSKTIMKLGIKGSRVLPECSFKKGTLLPEFVSAEDNKAFVISPLFFEEKAFGYIAMSFVEGSIPYRFELVQWIMNIARFLRDCCEAERTGLLSKHLEEIYLKDPLTGLYNRHGFSEHYERVGSLKKFKTMVLFDLDGLKGINDNFGHEEGDYALKTIGQAISNAAKEQDLCARFGGDEFYCLLSHDTEDYPEKYIERVNKFLNNYNALSDKPYKVVASSGYETVDSSGLKELSELFKAADKKLYDVKRLKKEKA